MGKFNLTAEETSRIQSLHESAPKKLDFTRFEFTINESEEKKSMVMEMMEKCCEAMYEAACLEGTNCMESYGTMSESLTEMMETYKGKCQETAITEGWISEEEEIEEETYFQVMDDNDEDDSGDILAKVFAELDEEDKDEE
jgi:hypothetical protein